MTAGAWAALAYLMGGAVCYVGGARLLPGGRAQLAVSVPPWRMSLGLAWLLAAWPAVIVVGIGLALVGAIGPRDDSTDG